MGKGGEEQSKHDKEGAAKAHLSVGEAAKEGSVRQSDSVRKCRVHVDYGRDLAG